MTAEPQPHHPSAYLHTNQTQLRIFNFIFKVTHLGKPGSEIYERVACIVKYSFEPWRAQQALSGLAASVSLGYFSVAFTLPTDLYTFEMTFGFRYAEMKMPLSISFA
jgi:hypothetical protein